MKLYNKVALITGADGGIDRETALRFAQEGAKIVAVDINIDTEQETVNLVRTEGGMATSFKADVSQAGDCRGMIQHVEEHFGQLNVLFNNAGIMHTQDDNALNTEEEIWDLTMTINQSQRLFLGCKYGISALRRAGGGSIINTASFVALLGAATPQIAYTASKVSFWR